MIKYVVSVAKWYRPVKIAYELLVPARHASPGYPQRALRYGTLLGSLRYGRIMDNPCADASYFIQNSFASTRPTQLTATGGVAHELTPKTLLSVKLIMCFTQKA